MEIKWSNYQNHSKLMIKSIALLTILILFFSLLLPWWILVVISFSFMIIHQQKALWRSIVISFLSGLLAYLFFSIFVSLGMERSPSELIGNLFGNLPSWSSYVITGLIGAVASAFGGVSGYLGNKLFQK